jgi:hypothetical protein
LLVALSGALVGSRAGAAPRSFVYTYESPVLDAGRSELAPWTTFRVGRGRYYSALDGRLGFSHGFGRGLQLALYWDLRTETRDVVEDSLTQALARVSDSEFASAAAELKYQLSDPSADALGSALYLQAALGPRQSALEARVIVDRSVGKWLLAGNAGAELKLAPTRGEQGSELETALVLQPAVAAAYLLSATTSLGIELRAPIGVSGSAESATLFGGPVLRWADQSAWAALGVEPQLLAFSGSSAGSRLDLNEHERLEVRLLAGFSL